MKHRLLHLFCVLTSLAVLSCTTSLHAQTHTWKKLYDHLAPFTVAFEINPLSHGRTLYAAVYPHSSQLPLFARSDDGGNTWQIDSIVHRVGSPNSANIHQIMCLPSDTSVLFALGSVVYRSSNGGMTWDTILPISSDDGDNIMYSEVNHTLYFSSSDTLQLWSSIDKGVTWTESPTAIPGMVCTMAVSPMLSQSPRYILAGSGRGSIKRSLDEGASWDVSLPYDTAYMAEISKLLYCPQASHTAIAACWDSRDRTVLMTTNDGESWSDLHVDSGYVWALALDPDPAKVKDNIPQHFWTGLLWMNGSLHPDVGETTDGGQNWTYSSFPDANTGVWILKYDPDSKTLFAAGNRGLYSMQIESSVRSPNSYPNDALWLSNDPLTNRIQVHWPSTVSVNSISVLDILGRTELTATTRASEFVIESQTLNDGIYFVQAVDDHGRTMTAKLGIVR